MTRKAMKPVAAITAAQVRTMSTTFFILPDDSKCPRPPRLGEEIRDQIGDLLDSIYNVGSTVFIGIRFIGPINDESFAHDQLARNKPPIAAIGAVVAVVAHREVMVGRHDD